MYAWMRRPDGPGLAQVSSDQDATLGGDGGRRM